MKENVLIKGNQDGLSIVVNESSDFEQIKSELAEKLETSRKFFGETKVIVNFLGRSLDESEEHELTDIFHEHSDMTIVCVIDHDNDLSKYAKQIKEELKGSITESVAEDYQKKADKELKQLKKEILSLEKKNKQLRDNLDKVDKSEEKPKQKLNISDEVTFHYSTLRSGQQVIENHNVVIMGDVNNGARVEAGGNVIVIGKLKGVVHAGLNGSDQAYIVALDMSPVQLRINNAIGRASDSENKKNGSMEPKIAFIEDSMIAIETIDNRVLKEIRHLG